MTMRKGFTQDERRLPAVVALTILGVAFLVMTYVVFRPLVTP